MGCVWLRRMPNHGWRDDWPENRSKQAVCDANAALLTATRSGVPGAYARLLADDLQWVAPDGRVLTKAERVA